MNKEEFDLIFIDDEMKMYNVATVIDELDKLNSKNSNVRIMLNKAKEFIKVHYYFGDLFISFVSWFFLTSF